MSARDEDVAVPLSVERVAEIAGRAAHLYEYGSPDADEWNRLAGADVPALVARIAELEAQRDRRRVRLVALQNDALSMRGSLSPMGEDRKVPFPLGETLTPAVDWLIGRVAELESERHSTNEALDDAVRELRARRDDVTPQVTRLRALLAGQREAVEGEFHAALHHAYDKGREMPVPGACGACGSAPETWCPDCAACQKGCHGGFVNNPCTHPNAPWGGA